MTKGYTQPTPIPKPREGREATEYLYLTNDATVILRYADAALEAALEAAPDAESAEDLRKTAANCKQTLRGLKDARSRTLRRYTPSGQLKPDQTNSRPRG